MKFHPPNQKFTHLYRRFLHQPAGGMILLLTTRGRRTGKPHTIGLQYEMIDGRYYVGAADGEKADWYRNLLNDPQVEVQVGVRTFSASAEVCAEMERIVDFLEYRIKKHPLMIRLILRLDGLKGRPDRTSLQAYAEKIRLVILTPQEPGQA